LNIQLIFEYTTEISKTRDVTSHLVFKIYNALFEHLEKSMKQLQRKRVPWKKHMLRSLEASRLKLDEYYSQTDKVRGHIYAISTMLAPDNRFQFFLSDDWDKSWRDKYRSAFQAALTPYQEHLSNTPSAIGSHTAPRLSSRLSKMLSGHKSQAKPVGDEATHYLDGGMFKFKS
jgi:hypothetical protein